LTTGLIVRGGVIGRTPGPALCPFLTPDKARFLLTGSPSSSFFSNNDIRAFAGPIELVSVARSSPATKLEVLTSSTLPGGCSLTAAPWAYGCIKVAVFGLGLGLADRLAASVAAMKDGERGSGMVTLAGVDR
jgi:hypothetical protein